jgi:hypothetical protein
VAQDPQRLAIDQTPVPAPNWPGGFGAALAASKPTKDDSYEKYLYQQYLKAQAAKAKQPPPSTLEKGVEFGRSVARGAVETAGSIAAGQVGLASGLGRLAGSEGFTGTPPSQIAAGAMGSIQSDAQRFAPERDPRFKDSLIQSVGEGVGSSVTFGVGGGLLAPAVGPMAGVGMLGSSAQFTSGYYDALAQTGDPEIAFQSGLLNAPAGLAEAIPLGGQVARFLGRVNKRSGGALGRVFGTAAIEGTEEAATETFTRGFGDLIASDVLKYDEDREFLKDALRQDALPAFIIGAVLGGLTSARDVPPDLAEKYGIEPMQPEAAPPQSEEEFRAQLATPTQVPMEQAEVAQAPVEAAPVAEPVQAAPVTPEPVAAPVAAPEPAAPQQGPVEAPQPTTPAAQPDPRPVVTIDGKPLPGPGRGPTGVKDAAVAREQERVGKEAPETAKSRSFPEVEAEAKTRFQADPFSGMKLVRELSDSPRAPTDVEDVLLSLEARRLINQRDAAEDAYNANPSDENKAAIDRAQADYDAAAQVFERTGSESSRSLNFRRLMFEADFSLAALERKARVAQGGQALTDEQRAELKEVADSIKRVEGELEKFKLEEATKRAELEAENAILRAQQKANQGTRRVARNKRKADTQAEIDALWKEFNAIGRQANALLDPKAVAIVLKLATKYARLGAITFEQFADDMVKRGGDAVKPYLKAAWDEAQAAKKQELSAMVKADKPLMKQRRAITRMVEQLVSEGVTDRDAVVDRVWEAIKPSLPATTRLDVIQAISGYGEYRQFTKDENKRTAADIRRQLLQVAKIEDLEAKVPPKRTGAERPPPSKAERDLVKKVNDLKRKLGIKSEGEDTLRSAEDAIKRRLENKIEDLRDAIEKRQAIVRDRGKPITTPEIERLRAEEKLVQAEYDAMFKSPEADRLARYTEAAQKTLAELERRLATGQLTPEPGKPKPTSEELDLLRAQIKAKREEIALARGDKKTPEQRRLQAYKTRKASELAKLLERNFYGLYEDPRPTKRTPKELKLDEEAAAVTARVEREKRKAKARIAEYERENATLGERAKRAVLGSVNLFRSIKSAWDLSAVLRQGVMFTVAHPYKAVTQWIPGMLKATFSAEEAAKIDAMIRNRNTIESQLPGANKLEITTLDGPLTSREENFRSTLAERFPGVKASERAFTTYLNLQRASMFDALVDRSMSKEEVEVIAQFVNIATGRGDFGTWKQVSAGASYILWSPSLLLSRIQLATGYSLWGGTAKSRKIVAKQYARTLLGLAAYYAAMSMFMEMDDDDDTYIGTDPRSSEFGKIVSGNTVLDPLGGVSQVMVLGSRVGAQVAANVGLTDEEAFVTRDGDTRELNFDDLANFARTKFTPVLGLSIDLVLKEGVYGRELPGPIEMVAPISVFDVIETMQEEGLVKGSALSVLQLLGQGTNIYQDQ